MTPHPAVVCDAIRGRRLLRLIGWDGVRVVEPYIYGCGAASVELLLCYQVEGVSRSGATTGWKTIRLAGVESADPMSVVSLRPRVEYVGHARGFASVHCQVRRLVVLEPAKRVVPEGDEVE